MENNQTNKNGTVSSAKKKKTHFLTSMAILAAALVIVVVIAVVTLVSGLGNSVFGTIKTLGGKTADELYSSIETTVDSTNNYTITLNKTGIAGVNGLALSAEVKTEITSRVDGNDFYIYSVTTTTYKKQNDTDVSKVEQEISVVDGVAYISTKKDGALQKQFKQNLNTDKYDGDISAFDQMLWQVKGLFTGAKFEKTDDGKFSTETILSDSDLMLTICNDIVNVFGQHSNWILNGTTCKNAEYSVVYDSSSKPTAVKYGYDISGMSSGTVDMTSTITYGNAIVSAPQNADEFLELEAE